MTDRSGRGSGGARRAARSARPDFDDPDSCGDADVRQLGALGRFVAAYGWRAYALPVLTVVTLVVLIDAVRESHPGPARSLTGADAPAATGASVAADALPAGGDFAVAGRGSWHRVPGTTGQIGSTAAREFTYTVEVEDGVTAPDGDAAFGRLVDRTLADPRGWTAGRRVSFRRIDGGTPDFRVSLTSRQTTRRVCGIDTPIDTSCFDQDSGRVVLDDARWVRGALPFRGDLGAYRQYVVNHEVGTVLQYRHAIEYHQPVTCQTDGGPAPVMMPQTFGTADDDLARFAPAGAGPNDGKVCRYNPWPYPRG